LAEAHTPKKKRKTDYLILPGRSLFYIYGCSVRLVRN